LKNLAVREKASANQMSGTHRRYKSGTSAQTSLAVIGTHKPR